jgi:hypothetical protein
MSQHSNSAISSSSSFSSPPAASLFSSWVEVPGPPSVFLRSLVSSLCEQAAEIGSGRSVPDATSDDALSAQSSYETSSTRSQKNSAGGGLDLASSDNSLFNSSSKKAALPLDQIITSEAVWSRISSLCTDSKFTSCSRSNNNATFTANKKYIFYKRPPVAAPSPLPTIACDRYVVFERGIAGNGDGDDGGDDDADVDGTAELDTSVRVEADSHQATGDCSSSSSLNHKHGDVIFRLAFRGTRSMFAMGAGDLMRHNRCRVYCLQRLLMRHHNSSLHFSYPVHAASASSGSCFSSTSASKDLCSGCTPRRFHPLLCTSTPVSCSPALFMRWFARAAAAC